MTPSPVAVTVPATVFKLDERQAAAPVRMLRTYDVFVLAAPMGVEVGDAGEVEPAGDTEVHAASRRSSERPASAATSAAGCHSVRRCDRRGCDAPSAVSA